MNQTYTGLVQQHGDWWIGWIKEIPGVNCQERTYEELLATLTITLAEALEFNREQAISIIESEYQEVAIRI